MKPNCLNPLFSSLVAGLRLFRGLLLLLLALALPAYGTINGGTIDFGAANTHSTYSDVSSDYNGLRFTGQWLYYIYDDLNTVATNRSGDAITSTSTGGDAIIKSANGTDRFNITSVKILAYGVGMTSFTFTGYRNSVAGPTETVNVTPGNTFVLHNLSNMTNVDEVRVTNNSATEPFNFAFDDLTVAAYSAPLSLSPASLTNPTVGSTYSQTISASGGNGTYSYTVTAGSLPAGLSLNASTGALTGTPTAGGAFNFTITATDTASATGSKAYSVTVAAPTISFSPTTLTAGTVGSAYSQSISGSGGTAPYGSYIVKTGALPAGLSLSSGGVVSGTPTAGGTFTFTVQGTDSSTGTGPYSATSSTISLTIGAPTLSFTPTTLTGGTVGVAYSQSLSGSGGTAPYGSFTLASGSLPPGLSLGSGGTVSGTPTAAGTYTFTVSAQDSSTGSGPYSGTSSTISLTIGAPTLSLSPAAGALTAASRGSAYSQTFSTSGGTSPYTYSITAGSLPAGLTLSSGGVLSGTPTVEGNFSFTVTATDSSGGTQYSTSQAYTLTVNPPLPVANAVSATVAYNSSNNAITLNITGGTATSVTVASAASHGTATASGTSITYTPTAGYSGSDSFTYTATNASGTSAPATVSITVNPQAPVANAVSVTVAFNSSNNAIPLSISGGAATSVAVASGASHGTATASGTSITYTPTVGYTGSDSFTYTATNATGTSAAATVTITVSAAAPVANAVSATVAFNSGANPIALNITGGVATSVSVATAAAHGTATASGTSITYTPHTGYSGSDSFTYRATNATGTSAPATVTITVNPAAPVAGAVTVTVPINSSNNPIPLNVSGGAATTVTVVTAPGHGTATASGASITYTPTAGYSGSDSFTYTATNATGTSAPATVTISVMTRPDPSKDANVVGIIGAQAEVAKRFSLTQISNFQSRLENLHVRLRPERPRGFDSPNARRPSVMPALAAVGNNSGPAAGNIDQNGGFGLATGTAVTNLGSRDAATGTGGVVTAGPAPGQESGFNPFAALSTLGQMANSHGLPTLNISSKASNFQDTGFDVWSAGNVSFGRLDDADAKFTTSGISFGTDSRFGDNLILGLGVGFGHERQKIGNDGTRNVGDDYSVIVYGSYQPVPGTFIDGLIGMGRLDLESRRYSAAAGAFATSQRTGKQWFASLSAAYEFQQDAHILSPYGRIDIASTRLDAAVESGAGIYNLAYFSQKAPVTKLSFGLRGETSVELETTLARPYFRVEYQHDFENPEGARMAYADDLSGPSYQIAATTLKRDTMVFGLGSDFVFKSAWTLGLRYQYSNNSGAMTMHTLGLQIRKSF